MFLCSSENPTEDKKIFHPRRETIFYAFWAEIVVPDPIA